MWKVKCVPWGDQDFQSVSLSCVHSNYCSWCEVFSVCSVVCNVCKGTLLSWDEGIHCHACPTRSEGTTRALPLDSNPFLPVCHTGGWSGLHCRFCTPFLPHVLWQISLYRCIFLGSWICPCALSLVPLIFCPSLDQCVTRQCSQCTVRRVFQRKPSSAPPSAGLRPRWCSVVFSIGFYPVPSQICDTGWEAHFDQGDVAD